MYTYIVGDKEIAKLKKDDRDFRPEKVLETIVSVLRWPEMQEEGSAMLLNIVIHFIKNVNFTIYQSLIDDLIQALKETEVNSQGQRVPKYKAKIIWKSSTAIRKENAEFLNVTARRFMTTQVGKSAKVHSLERS